MKKYLQGIIKATYAELFDADGNKIFSMQKADVGDTAVVMAEADAHLTDKGLVRVSLTDAGMALMDDKMKADDRRTDVFTTINETGAFVKPEAFDWKAPINKTLLFAGAGLLGLLLLNKFAKK